MFVRIVAFLALLPSLAFGAAHSEDKVNVSADYYLPGLQPAYFDFATSIAVLHDCIERIPDCPKEVVSQKNNISSLGAYVNAIKLFGARGAQVLPSRSMDGATVLKEWSNKNEQFRRDTLSYEIEFMARYGAIGLTCPKSQLKDPDLQLLISALETLDFDGFWKLPPDQGEASRLAVKSKTKIYQQEVDSWHNNELCILTRNAGAPIARLLKERLRPYAHGKVGPASRGEQIGSSMSFVWGAAALIQGDIDDSAVLPPLGDLNAN